MRIISGKNKGRKLETPADNKIRPTTDKVKEAIFSILLPWIEDAEVLDLFAGTGGIGLEALSRGAKFCYFCDNDRNSINIIKNNIATLNEERNSKVIYGDYNKGLKSVPGKLDIIFIDPPYGAGLYAKVLKAIELLDLLRDDGIIIVEHEKEMLLPERSGIYLKSKERSYGRTILSMYIKE